MASDTRMFEEAAAAAEALRAQFARNSAVAEELGRTLRRLRPRVIVTCARGSSDHAATFGKYLIETYSGVPTCSAAPSVSSVYAVQPDIRDSLFIVISQSGESPDLLASAQRAREAGARVLALVNAEGSQLARHSDFVLPLCAAPEIGVAATKSWIASLAALVHLVSAWTENKALADALRLAPGQLEAAWALQWPAAIESLREASNMYVIGRGYGLAAAQESALKLKETCMLHAEAISAAEVWHGPMALVRESFNVLLYAQDDETLPGIVELADALLARGARVLLAGVPHPRAEVLPAVNAHPVIQPMLSIQSFYRMANSLALARGLNPDRPPHLRKVTETF